ncbi:DUF2163 domain-containing protein [Aestuariicella hydrocarbonica]|uniref:DUF2163 domain-containing protein n=1 Tax=Pseudomaricurvus hydrocarbonicus TaxID=1470433 RepID=A0A9E5MJ72_9GAMM|nr:DUF2163 domain-containing protein [Aestuariicella hydrocarbonica]NHO64614.1 DUF2163 domain-containing protein [Aestuariicella hydrocarbonica]
MTAVAERRTLMMRIEALDGTIERIAAQYPHDLLVSQGGGAYVNYFGGLHTTTSNIQSQAEGGGAVIDFGFVEDLNHIDREQVHSGKWDGAQVYVFATDWSLPVEDEEPIARFTVGKIMDQDGRYTTQLMGQRDRLNQNNQDIYSAQCIYTFCDYHLDTGVVPYRESKCQLDKDDFIVTGTITSVDDSANFYDSTRPEADDWFGNGEIIFTTGQNAGQPRQNVRSFTQSGGKIVTSSPFYYPPQVGDAYQMIAGCRKRGKEDCTGKHSNRVHFGGYSYVPVTSQVAKFEAN